MPVRALSAIENKLPILPEGFQPVFSYFNHRAALTIGILSIFRSIDQPNLSEKIGLPYAEISSAIRIPTGPKFLASGF